MRQAVNLETLRTSIKRGDQLQRDLDEERRRTLELKGCQSELEHSRAVVVQLRSDMGTLQSQLHASEERVREFEKRHDTLVTTKADYESQV